MRTSTATILLLGVTAVWGWTFVIVHDAIVHYGVVPFLAARFAIAAAAALVLWGRRLDRASLTKGAWIGVILAVGYLLQTWGLRHTTATNSGLITGLFVVLAPIADRAMYGTRLRPVAWLAVAFSLLGMTFLTGRTPTSLALGDVLTIGCAVAFGIHIAVLSRHAGAHDPRALGAAQMVAVGAIFLALWPAAETPRLPPPEIWFALLVTGLLASTLAYAIQTAAQRSLSAVRTAIILTTEPIFAGAFGFLLAGERLRPLQLFGAGLILLAVVVSEIVPVIRLERAPR